MFKFNCAVLVVAFAATLLESSTATKNVFGIVEGIKDCGSSGVLGRVEVTDCTQLPCRFIPHNSYDVAIRFVSSTTSSSLGLMVFKMENGLPQHLLELDINGTIEAGIEYELKFVLPVGPELADMDFDIQFYILDKDNFKIEVCAEAAVTIDPLIA